MDLVVVYMAGFPKVATKAFLHYLDRRFGWDTFVLSDLDLGGFQISESLFFSNSSVLAERLFSVDPLRLGITAHQIQLLFKINNVRSRKMTQEDVHNK